MYQNFTGVPKQAAAAVVQTAAVQAAVVQSQRLGLIYKNS
jgi:hypothetical protein